MNYQASIMLAAGLGIPILAALNAALGTRIGSPSAAAFVLFLVALMTASLAVSVTGIKPLHLLGGTPKHLYLAGTLVAFYVLSITYIAPEMGVGKAIFFVLLGQLIGATLIDHFGLFGAKIQPLDIRRFAGLVIMAIGVWVCQHR